MNDLCVGELAAEGMFATNFLALVVEDDALQREVIADLLKDEGLEVVECSSAEAAEQALGGRTEDRD
jgi:CheY-like chemotaxis protein